MLDQVLSSKAALEMLKGEYRILQFMCSIPTCLAMCRRLAGRVLKDQTPLWEGWKSQEAKGGSSFRHTSWDAELS